MKDKLRACVAVPLMVVGLTLFTIACYALMVAEWIAPESMNDWAKEILR